MPDKKRRVGIIGVGSYLPKDVLTKETLTAVFGLHMGLVDSHAMPNGNTKCIGICCEEEK